MERRDAIFVAICLAGIAVALVLVGAVSHTIPRHLVQIVPLVLGAGLVLGRNTSASYAAVGLCAFWAVIMGLIWLYLLGLSGVVSGTYSAVEIALTVVIAVFSVLGILKGTRADKQISGMRVPVLIAVAFVIQAVVTSVSIRFLN
ncbi:MAG: hypothetical protein F4X66_04875 [Chloroflexi bacterium]|nr:hypothetical protein [Chloroflexota bacterium]MYE40623.1 hypothetical protein [Chloroflexota bacterium]